MSHKIILSLFATAFLVLATGFNSFAHAQANTKEEEMNLAVNKRFFNEVVNQGKLDLIDKLFSPDFVEHEAFPGLQPNREGVKQFFRMFRQAFPDLNFKLEFTIAKEDKVVSYITTSGTHRGEFMGMAATGKQINVKAIDIVRFKDGVAVEHWGMTDAMAMMEQLGAIPGSEAMSEK